jgi:hypothetical protein
LVAGLGKFGAGEEMNQDIRDESISAIRARESPAASGK